MNKFELFSDGNPENAHRLIERQKRIVDANLDAIKGKTVLDIAANNGRWSYAAIAAGASGVVSVEGRKDRVADARKAFEELGISEKVKTNIGDMYEWLRENRALKVDTVFCLGIYYHIMDHYMLLKYIAALDPQSIIIDSGFVRSFRNSVHIQSENPNLHLNALTVYPGQKGEIVGFVSLGLMMQMAWNLGYTCRPVPWDPADVKHKKSVHDYLIGRRFTVRLDKMKHHNHENWQEDWRETLRLLNPRFTRLLDRKTHDSMIDARVSQPFKSMEYSVM